ncbi:hypothetical protein CSE45_0511 [Citreicella sp. SE45]|nr:hypothetical protein CSE45_0511 [Citreicella sp. SE45]
MRRDLVKRQSHAMSLLKALSPVSRPRFGGFRRFIACFGPGAASHGVLGKGGEARGAQIGTARGARGRCWRHLSSRSFVLWHLFRREDRVLCLSSCKDRSHAAKCAVAAWKICISG